MKRWLSKVEEVKQCPTSQRLQLVSKKFTSAVVGGVFDHFHLGHKSLIQTAFQFAEQVHLTLMDDKWVKKRGKDYVNDFERFKERLEHVKEFLDSFGLSKRSRTGKISDPFNYALEGKYANKLESLVVSEEKGPRKRARRLNKLRKNKGLPPLNLLETPLLKAPTGKAFSSTKIRKGGKEQENDAFKGGVITEKVKPVLRRKKGEVAEAVEELPSPPKHVISVGDKVSESLIKKGYPVSVLIIDGKVRREKTPPLRIMYEKHGNELEVPLYLPCQNPPGRITKSAWTSLKVAFFQEKPVIVKTYGEEDLLGLLATVLAPTGSLILYGQPPNIGKEGIVHFRVNEDRRREAIAVLREMNAF